MDPLQKLWDRQAEWSQATFGSDATRGPIGPLKHLAKEAEEAAASPTDHEEYADCFLLVLDAARRAGMSLDVLISAAVAKHEKCRLRTWAVPIDDEPVFHTSEGA